VPANTCPIFFQALSGTAAASKWPVDHYVVLQLIGTGCTIEHFFDAGPDLGIWFRNIEGFPVVSDKLF
jgi:hypothetical protein